MAKRMSIKEIIETYKEVGGNYTQAALFLGVSRSTVKRWVKRGTSLYGNVTFRGIERRSTRPHTIRGRTTLSWEKEVVSLRQQTGLCADKLQYLLRKKGILLSVSTIERILRRKGLQKRENKYYRRPLFQNGKAMRPKNTTKPGYLQMDVKYVTPELSGLPYTCYEYGLIDIFSRYKVSLILPILDESGSILALKWAIQSMPLQIVYVQTDNGLEYQKTFHRACEELNIVHYHIHKSSPNENAVIERSFRVDQEEFFFRLKQQPKDINELNQQFQEFLHYYNTERPHLGINLLTPKEKLDTVSNVMKD
jgi:transposase InsO family protein